MRQSPSPTPQEVKPDAKPPTPTKKISKLDLGKLKTMVKPAEAKSKVRNAASLKKNMKLLNSPQL